ncbi:MAG TPA: 4-hydroxybenzoate octaprenyltransferase [Thermoplasmata archaeon]|nr:4-hydroxybenzoate octaprenyltransferase [Thermoplasmata archaeon]
MSGPGPPAIGAAREVGRFLEIQNLGLNLPFALAFLLVAAGGLPTLWVLGFAALAFVAARNAGHSFNRWADRAFDRANPRTEGRALPAGRLSPSFALLSTAAWAAVLFVAAAAINLLALELAPVALLLILSYSYTKRLGWWTTPFLGLVESITPAAAFVAVRGDLPVPAFVAAFGFLAWGTAFETIHSLGDVDADRGLGLHSIPVRFGVPRAVRTVPILHGIAFLDFAAFGVLSGLRWPYFAALVAMGGLVAFEDARLFRDPARVRGPFRAHIALGLLFLLGTAGSIFLAGLLP